ncbi:hypothetical protein ACM9XD_03130 [Xanthomonas sacchari]
MDQMRQGSKEVAKEDKIILQNEQDAWGLLERALNKDPRLENATITFSNWPRLEITVRGRDLEGTIPSRFLPALMECQESVYKIYCYAKYKEFSTRRLKDSEKRKLELVYKVEKGSSEFAAQAAEALQKIALEAATKMTPMQLTVFLCLVALLFTGHSGFKHWLKYKENKNDKNLTGRAVDALAESNRIIAESNKANAERDIARNDLLKKAVSSTKAAKLAYEGASAAYTRLALSMDAEDNLVVDGIEVPGKELRSAVLSPRMASESYNREGPAVLRSVANDARKGFIVGVKFLDADYDIQTSVERNRLIDEEMQTVGSAVVSSKAVWVHVEGRWRRGNVEGATILSVRELSAVEKKNIPKSLGGTKPNQPSKE